MPPRRRADSGRDRGHRLGPGVTDGTLDPATPLTRAALAKLLFRYAAVSSQDGAG